MPEVILAMSPKFLGIIIVMLSLAPAQLPGAETEAVRLKDLSGKVVEPLANHGQKVTVLFFLTTECPIGNRYAP